MGLAAGDGSDFGDEEVSVVLLIEAPVLPCLPDGTGNMSLLPIASAAFCCDP